jgi:hypothetical protein
VMILSTFGKNLFGDKCSKSKPTAAECLCIEEYNAKQCSGSNFMSDGNPLLRKFNVLNGCMGTNSFCMIS